MANETAELNLAGYQQKLAGIDMSTPEGQNEFLVVLGEISKQKAAIAKAQAEAAQKEAEALAGQREALAEEVRKAVDNLGEVIGKLAGVKAWGFTYVMKGHVGADGVPLSRSSCALSVPVVKKSRTPSGSGAPGVTTEAETGLKLDDLFTQYANDEEKAKIAVIDADASLDAKAKNSKKWQAKNQAKKRILADNPNLVQK